MEDKAIHPKFTVKYLGKTPPDDPRIKKLIYWRDEFSKLKLMPEHDTGSFGNLSFRTNKGKNTFIITASGEKGGAGFEDFVEVSMVNFDDFTVHARGMRAPSSETFLHYMIYNKRPDINAIFHGHCERIIKNYQKLNLLCTLREEPYGTIELADSVLKVLSNRSFLIMKDHGFLSFGADMDEAGKRTLQILENLG